MQLVNAFGQRCRAGLQDIGRFDLVDVSVPDGRDLLPSLSARNLVDADSLAAPRGDDDVGSPIDHCFGGHDSVAAEPRVAKVGKNRIPTGNLDELLDPADTG